MTTSSSLITPHFSWAELADREGHLMPSRVRGMLQLLCEAHLEPIREEFGRPMRISSGYRSPEHSAERNKKFGPGAHSHGLAVDILVHGDTAKELVKIALDQGVMGLGLKQHGPHEKRFVHMDWWKGDINHPRPWIFTYR